MKTPYRKRIDTAMGCVIHITAYVSVLVLLVMTILFLYQGIIPFVSPDGQAYVQDYGEEDNIQISTAQHPYRLEGFFFGKKWSLETNRYGILPLAAATLAAALGAVVLAISFTLPASLLVSEFLPQRPAALVRSVVDLSAALPSVVYGFFGFTVIVPLIRKVFLLSDGTSLLAAIITLSIMITPTVMFFTISTLDSVPDSYRDASFALGAAALQTAWRMVLPRAKSGITAGIIFGTSRAIGETMAVILVAGNIAQVPNSLVDKALTMTAAVVLQLGPEAGRENQILFSVGVLLFLIIGMLNHIGMKLLRRKTTDHDI